MLHSATIADSLSPRELADLAQSFGLETTIDDYIPQEFISDEWLESRMGMVTSDHLWDAMWRFGIVLDDDCAKVHTLGSLWRPDGKLETGYYVPTDYDVEIPLVSLDNPPKLLSIAEQEAA